MEAAEKRKVEEKQRRLAQERDRVERERVVREKVAASTFSRGYLSGIVASVFTRLQASARCSNRRSSSRWQAAKSSQEQLAIGGH